MRHNPSIGPPPSELVAEPSLSHGDRHMTDSRPTFTGRDAAGAGVLLISVNLLCAGIGAGIGALVGAVVPLLLAGFFAGFFVGIAVVAKRYRHL